MAGVIVLGVIVARLIVFVRHRRSSAAHDALERFAAIQPIAKGRAAMLAAEPERLSLVLDCPRRRFVDLHVTDGINRHEVPRGPVWLFEVDVLELRQLLQTP